MVVRDLLIRGLLTGLLAGVLAFGVAEALGEPQMSRAISFETQLHNAEHQPADPAPVSRDIQRTLGLATGVLAIGTAIGGLFALAFAFAYGRIGRVSARVTAVAVAGAGFGAIYLVPFLKYPPNPPSIGHPSTIDHRTGLYFGLLLVSATITIGAMVIGRRLTPRLGAWNATLVTGAATVAVIVVVFTLMPGVNEIPVGFPAVTVWRFRMASLATQLTLWTTIGLVFGALIEHSPADRRRRLMSAFR